MWAESAPASSHASPTDDGAVEKQLSTQDLDGAVDRVLSRIIPPMVEKLVQERLDKLLKEQDQMLDLKP